MQFDLKVFRESDGVSALALEAADRGAARRHAEAQGYRVLSLRESSSWRPARWIGQGFSLPLFCEEILALQEAGLSLIESLAILVGKARQPEARRILAELERRVAEGLSFSQALEAGGGAFPPLFVATLRACEQSGNLADGLRRYLAYRRQLDAVRDRIVSASVYPALLVLVGVLVVLFLMVYVVPRFSRVFEDIGPERLPLLSRWLMQWGQGVADHWPWFLWGLPVLVASGAWIVSRPGLRAAIGRWLWALPVIGEQMRIFQLARFTRTVAMLIRGGIPLVAALAMTEQMLHQPALRRALAQARRSIAEGQSVSAAFGANGLATEIGTRLLVVGERSGELGETMARIADFYDEEIARSVAWFSRLFEPALMLVIGLVIGGVVVLMYLPIFELAGSIR